MVISGKDTPAVILGGSVNGLSFVRSLYRCGVPTVLVASQKLISTYTRLGRVVLLPKVKERPGDWIEFLTDFARKSCSAPVLFATSDEHCMFVAKHGDLLGSCFRFLIPPAKTLEQIIDKKQQYEIAQQAGILIPSTWFPKDEGEVESIAEEVPFPCILKPYKSHVARRKRAGKVIVVRDGRMLRNQYNQVTRNGLRYMVQEIVPGGDSELYVYLAFWDESGKEVAWLTWRKLRQNPPLFGDGSLQMTVERPEIAELSRHLLRAFDYRGFVGVEFKRDPRDGEYRLMEINPRTLSGNQLAITAGVDFPSIAYRHLCGLEPRAARAFRPQVKYVNEEEDFRAFIELRRSGELGLIEWCRSVMGAEALAIFAANDPGPFLAMLARIVRVGVRSLLLPGTRRP